LNLHRLPAVTYLKAGAYQDGHAGYSDPIDEQIFVVGVINALMQSPEWNETAVDESAGGSQIYLEDCQACCKPNVLRLEWDQQAQDYVIHSELE